MRRYETPTEYEHDIPVTNHIVGFNLYDPLIRRLFGWKRDLYVPKLILTDDHLIHHQHTFFGLGSTTNKIDRDDVIETNYTNNLLSTTLVVETSTDTYTFRLHDDHADELCSLQI